MLAQYIQLGRRSWNVLVYYNVNINNEEDYVEIEDSLTQLECSQDDINNVFKTLVYKNTGFTFSNTEYKMSIVCISEATNIGQFVHTAVHEAKHVQSHICQYYGIDEYSEAAAYLIGHLVRRMYAMLSKFIKAYV